MLEAVLILGNHGSFREGKRSGYGYAQKTTFARRVFSISFRFHRGFFNALQWVAGFEQAKKAKCPPPYPFRFRGDPCLI